MAKQSTTPRTRSTHTCSQAEAIKIIQEQINGNGKKGIREVVNTLSSQMETLATNVDTMQTDVKVLLRFQTQVMTKEEEYEKHNKEIATLKKEVSGKQRWLVALILSTTLTLLGLIVAIVSLFNKIS